MTAPRSPRTRCAVFIALFGGFSALYLWLCLGWRPDTVFVGHGLVLDVIGAFVVAIPDIPSFHKHFFSGKLQTGLNQLRFESEGSAANELAALDTDERLLDALMTVENARNITVDKMLDVVSVVREDDPPSEGFYEIREVFKENETNEDVVSSWDDVYGFKVFEGERGIRSLIMMEEEGTAKVRISGTYGGVFGLIEDRVEELVARFRRFGLTLLIIGFLFQGVSLLFS